MWWVNRISVVALLVAVFGVGCGREDPSSKARIGKPVVYTTFYPTKYFAERIGGDLVRVVCPVPVNEDASFWMPDRETVRAYQEADLVVVNGAEFAKWVQKVSLREHRIVNTAKPLADELITFEHATVHSHGTAGDHAHEGLDGHTWVDPVNAAVQAYEIRKALAKRFPEHGPAFEKGFAALAADLDALDKKLGAYQAACADQPLLASHPAFNYVARRYGWNIANLNLDPGEMPSDEVIQAIETTLREHPAKFLVWEAFPSRAIADRLEEELGLTSIEFSPCELLSEEDLACGKDYLNVMWKNLENIGIVFR